MEPKDKPTPAELISKLKRRQVMARVELQKRLKQAQKAVAAKIEVLSDKAKIATSDAARKALYAQIEAIYAAHSAAIDSWMKDQVSQTAIEWNEQAKNAIKLQGAAPQLLKFDRDRVKRYWELIHGKNTKYLAGVFTQQMASSDLRNLRSAFLDTFRQSTIESWTTREIHKNLQSKWDSLAKNLRSDRFVDATGRPWTNADYLSMLTRTTLQRVANESYVDGLVEEGYELARIIDDGEPCQYCQAWAGLIVDISGKQKTRYPSLAQAYDGGWGHPNCGCYPEAIIPEIDGAEIKRQQEQPAVNWSDPKQVQQYNDEIRIQEKRDNGMSKVDATRDLKRDKIKKQLRLAGYKFDDAVDAIPPDVLDKVKLGEIPRIEAAKKGDIPNSVRNSSLGGILRLDRKAGPGDFSAAFMQLQERRGNIPKVVKPVVTGAEKVRDRYITHAQEAGFSQGVIERIKATPAAVFNAMPDPPKLVVGKSAFYRPWSHEVHMAKSPGAWSGHPTVFDHELGHAIHTSTNTIKGGHIDDGLREAIEKDYAAWKKKAKAERGSSWGTYFKRSNYKMHQDHAVKIGAKDYASATTDQQHRVSGLLDTIGGLSKGNYGDGHPVSYYKQEGGVKGYKEVYANMYRAAVNDWPEYARLAPLTSQWIKNNLGI